ncbi:LysR family transcriptional regulator [Rhodococcus sp. T2V]|uniref:LysR family transcriptional regulator n=1 Tax=Rhodococcus sp. T2V TaxID=3034164 RepID=UPI0023E1E50C|nr:LysR family transcriptional regulator [Rhodococcus sp. T2V]MDF3313095.1 LysR family transcriptional regulator [Rhodococcus sp. T2V]
MIDLRVLGYILTVADCGSVAGAANLLNVGQPSISRQIVQVERTLGFELFERVPRGMVLTPAGRTYIERARDLVTRAGELDSIARDIAAGAPTKLSIAAPTVTITDILAPYIAHGEAIPGLELTLIPAPGASSYQLLGADADIAIASAPPTADLEWRVIGQVPLCAQMPDTHRLASKDMLLVEDLSHEKLILREAGHQIRLVTDRAFAGDEQEYFDFAECAVPRHAQALAASGAGIAILTDITVFGLRTIPIHTHTGPVEVAIHAAWRPNHFAHKTITTVVEGIAEHYAKGLTA